MKRFEFHENELWSHANEMVILALLFIQRHDKPDRKKYVVKGVISLNNRSNPKELTYINKMCDVWEHEAQKHDNIKPIWHD